MSLQTAVICLSSANREQPKAQGRGEKYPIALPTTLSRAWRKVTLHNPARRRKGRKEEGMGNQQHSRPWRKVTQHNPVRRKEEGKKGREEHSRPWRKARQHNPIRRKEEERKG